MIFIGADLFGRHYAFGRLASRHCHPTRLRLAIAKVRCPIDTPAAPVYGVLLESRMSMLILKSFILKLLLGFGFGLIILALL